MEVSVHSYYLLFLKYPFTHIKINLIVNLAENGTLYVSINGCKWPVNTAKLTKEDSIRLYFTLHYQIIVS